MYIAGVGRISTATVEKKRGVSMKRLGVYMLSLCLFFSMLVPVSVKAEDSSRITVDGYEYEVLNDHEVKLWYYFSGAAEHGDVTNPDIPSEITYNNKKYRVVEFYDSGNVNLKKLVLPEGIKKVTLNEFKSFKNLTELHLPSTLEDINAGFCYSMENLKKIVFAGQETNYENDFYQLKDGVLIDKRSSEEWNGSMLSKEPKELICYPAAKEGKEYTVPEGIVTVRKGCFVNAKYLESLRMSSTVKNLNGGVFKKSNLKEIDLRNVETVTNGGGLGGRGSCFDYCKQLETVKIGSKTSFDAFPFYENDSLKTIEIDPQNPYYEMVDGVMFGQTNKGRTLICYPAKLERTEYTVPEDTQYIAYSAFNMCHNLKKVMISKSVSAISTAAFNYGDDGLSKNAMEIDFYGDSLPVMASKTFCDLYDGSKMLFKNQNLVNEFNQGNYIYSLSGSKEVSVGTLPEVKTESITLSKHEIFTVMDYPKEKVWHLITRVNPSFSTDAVKFVSSDPSIVTVDDFGVVKAGKKLGRATITASAGTKQDTCTVIVKGNMNNGENDNIIISAQEKGGETGKPVEAWLYVYYDRKLLVEGKDYVVSYENNIGGKNGTCKEVSREKRDGQDVVKGLATVIITGKGNFTGVAKENYEITWWEKNSNSQTSQPTPSTTEKTKPTVSTKKKITYVSKPSNATYTGKNIKKGLSVKAGGKKLKLNRDYTISYVKNKDCGKAKMVVRGKGNYTGTYIRYFKIKPKKARMKKIKAGKRKMTVYISKSAGKVSGYQIWYSQYKSFKKSKYKTTGRTTYAIKKLSRKKSYYVKVRAYKMIDGKKYYGSYSSYKKIKVR